MIPSAATPDPADRPVTRPVLLTETIDIVEGSTLHTPLAVPSLNCVVRPLHTAVIPVIGSGCVLIVTTLDEEHPPIVSVHIIVESPVNEPMGIVPVTIPV